MSNFEKKTPTCNMQTQHLKKCMVVRAAIKLVPDDVYHCQLIDIFVRNGDKGHSDTDLFSLNLFFEEKMIYSTIQGKLWAVNTWTLNNNIEMHSHGLFYHHLCSNTPLESHISWVYWTSGPCIAICKCSLHHFSWILCIPLVYNTTA